MLKYKIDVLKALKEKGYNTYVIRKEKLFAESELQRIRKGKVVSASALDRICDLLSCQPGDLIYHISNDDADKN